MTASTRTTVLSLYMRVFRIARNWQAQSGVPRDTETERRYILQEARTLFRQNQQLTEQESIKRCIEECEARIEIGENGEKLQVFFTCSYAELKTLQPKSVQNDVTYTNTSDSVSAESLSVCQSLHYRNPYPRATYLPPLGLATQKGRKLRAQQRLRKQAKPIYLQSHDET